MMLKKHDQKIIDKILLHEHQQVALRLDYINEVTQEIDDELLHKTISLISDLSHRNDELAKRIIITLSSILWTYKKTEWSGLKDFLVKVLSKIGYAPSSIMVDHEYNHDLKQFSGGHSFLDQMATTIAQLECEVVLKNKIFLLTQFQKNIWTKIDENETLGISAPTSAGKSFIIALKAIELLLQKDGSIIYIVPTLSLVSQVSIDFRRLLNLFGLRNYEIVNTYNGNDDNNKKIYVLTQEKAIGAFSQKAAPFQEVRFLVVDEIQNVERASDEDGQRAKTLYDLIIEFRHSPAIDRIVISGPRIEGIGELCSSLFGAGSAEEKDRSSPVASFTYSIENKNKKYFFKQHADIKSDPTAIEFSPKEKFPKPDGVIYNEKYHDFMHEFICKLGHDSKNIIFSPKPDQARKTAIALAEKLPEISSVELSSLIDYLAETVHSEYSLCDVLKRGVAYHHGRIPHHARRVLEKAVSNKLINNVVCTTTLMQGVNLPAQNVILRNPNLYVKELRDNPPKLTQYEVSNLRGRAGRLLKDFIGRTFVLDENAFDRDIETDNTIFEDKYKKISAGYGETFRDNRDSLKADLVANAPPENENKEYSFLLTYIRQMIIRHQDKSMARFRTVGIDLSNSDFIEIKRSLENLTVPEEVCIKNRYWDPIDLEMLYQKKDEFNLPSSLQTADIAGKLYVIVQHLQELIPSYTKRYFKVREQVLFPICISAEQWAKEKTLKEILSSDYHDDAEKIEETINSLQNKISYGLPLLLKPLYDMILPTNSFLRFIETGAYHPLTRRLIEYNIPRETAIFLSDKFDKSLKVDAPDFDFKLKNLLQENLKSFDYWVRVQLEALLSFETAND